MTWSDSLQRVTIDGKIVVGCSFRGAPFFIESSDHTGGRLGETHIFPYKESEPAFREDLGLGEQGFSISGYLVGDNIESQKRALRDALNASGPGELIHAYWGKMTASVESFTISERAGEGRFVRISIDFVQSTETPAFPLPEIDAGASLSLANKAFLAAVKAAHLAKYNPASVVSDFLTDLEDIVRTTANALNAPGSSVISVPQTLATFRQRLNYMATKATSVVGNSVESYEATERALNFAFSAPRIPGPILRLLAFIEENFNSPPDSPSGQQTESRETQAALYLQLARATKRQVLAKCIEIAGAAQFAIYADARKVRDALLARVEAELSGEDDDATWQALEDLRVNILRAIPTPAEQAKEITSYTPSNTVSSLVLTHRIYGDLSRESEVVERNNIAHPGFIPGGVALEIAVDVG